MKIGKIISTKLFMKERKKTQSKNRLVGPRVNSFTIHCLRPINLRRSRNIRSHHYESDSRRLRGRPRWCHLVGPCGRTWGVLQSVGLASARLKECAQGRRSARDLWPAPAPCAARWRAAPRSLLTYRRRHPSPSRMGHTHQLSTHGIDTASCLFLIVIVFDQMKQRRNDENRENKPT